MIRLNTEELELIGKHLSVFAHAWPPKKCSSKWRGNCLCAANPDLAMEPSAAGVAAPDTFVMAAHRKAYWKEYDAKRRATPQYKAYRKKYQDTPRYKAYKKEYDAKRRATPQYKAYMKKYQKEYRKERIVKGTPQNKQKARDYRADWYARNVQCVLEPIHTVWGPLDGTTAFDTEERICGACWLVEDDRGAGRGDTEDPWELQRLHDAWLEKEFFFKKKNNGAKKWPVKGCPDCGTLVSSPSMARHRRLYCKSRQLLSLQQDLRSMSAVLLCMRAAVAAAVPAVGDAPADEA